MIKIKKSQEFLGEHVTNIILAALAIALLLLLGAGLVNILFRNKAEANQAKADLEKITAAIAGLEKEGDFREVILYNPEDWSINYQHDISTVGMLPKVCEGRKCLCICEYESTKEDILENCDDPEKGVCEIFDSKLIEVGEILDREGEIGGNIKISGVLKIKVSFEEGIIKIRKMLIE